MPAKSNKEKLKDWIVVKAVIDLTVLEELGKFREIFFDCAACDNCILNSHNESEEYEILEKFLENICAVLVCRYGIEFIKGSVPKSRHFVSDVLPIMDECRFIEIARINKRNFEFILNLIKNDDSFTKKNSWKQFPVAVQLLIVLYRLRCSGEGASIGKIAKFFGIGGIIAVITSRVFKAILKLKNKYIFWPEMKERQKIIAETYDELPYYAGYVDGTEIRLAGKLSVDPEAYFSRKHQYSIKVQAVWDHKEIIRNAVTGYPGSVYDSRIYKDCLSNQQPTKVFTGCEWLLGDSTYKLSTTVITPYRSKTKQVAAKEANGFNRRLSQFRVRIEDCFGLLKEQFCSLKELKIAIRNSRSIKIANQWIFVCCILHNIILGNSSDEDELMQTEANNVGEEDSSDDEDYVDSTSNEETEMKGKAILERFLVYCRIRCCMQNIYDHHLRCNYKLPSLLQ